jgi:hypothetical protein
MFFTERLGYLSMNCSMMVPLLTCMGTVVNGCSVRRKTFASLYGHCFEWLFIQKEAFKAKLHLQHIISYSPHNYGTDHSATGRHYSTACERSCMG